MRPRKVVLVVSGSEVIASLQKFMLDTRGYLALVARDVASAMQIVLSERVDVVLCNGGTRLDWAALSGEVKAADPHTSVVMLWRGKSSILLPYVDVVLDARSLSNAELLGQMRSSTARKRGPVKRARPAPLMRSGVNGEKNVAQTVHPR